MNLFTDEQYQQLLKNGSDPDKNYPPVAHLFMPWGRAEWLISEINPECPHIAFGLCDLGMGFPELGYVDLQELQAVKVGPFQLGVENNDHFQGKYPMSVYASAARVCGAISRNEPLLRKVYAMELVKKQNKLRP